MQIDRAGAIGHVNQVNQSKSFLDKIQERLSTGKKLNRASDDAAMIAVAKELEKQVRGFKQTEVNLGDAMSALRIADGTGEQVSAMLQRQRELSIQASNDTLSNDQRSYLDQEYQALGQEITRISKSANYNGQDVASGGSALSDGSGQYTTGANGENANTAAVPGGSIATSSGARAALSSIDAGLRTTNATRSTIGAQLNGMQSNQNNAANQRINQTDALSRAEDLDYAQGAADQARASLLNQSSLAATRQFNNIQASSMQALLGG